MIVSASEAGGALSAIADALLRHSIVSSEGYDVLTRLARELKLAKQSPSWTIEVDRGSPILFKQTADEKNRVVQPRIVAKKITIQQEEAQTILPFQSLDIALEIFDNLNNPISRWHLDLANKNGTIYQSGPITHLQFGGHNHGAREHDYPLKVPRWCHPPMEIALLCEVIAANFYEEYWLELREEASWCQAISVYQKLCYTYYLKKMLGHLSISSSTMLKSMWASTY